MVCSELQYINSVQQIQGDQIRQFQSSNAKLCRKASDSNIDQADIQRPTSQRTELNKNSNIKAKAKQFRKKIIMEQREGTSTLQLNIIADYQINFFLSLILSHQFLKLFNSFLPPSNNSHLRPMEQQKQSKALSETYTDADDQGKKEIIRLIFPASELESQTLSQLRANLLQHFNLSQHKTHLINHAFKNHHSSAAIYQEFILSKYPDLSEPQISAFYLNQYFPELKYLSQYQANPKFNPKRHVAPLQTSFFIDLDYIFKEFGYIPSLQRFLIFFPNFLHKIKIVQIELFENTKIDQQTTFFLALCAAAEMGCPYMINRMALKYLSKGGKFQWIEKKKYPSKISIILSLNRKLARCVWDLSSDDFDQIIEGGYWSANQLAFIIQILSYVHSLCLITLGLGLIPEEKNSLIQTQKIQQVLKEYRQTRIQIGQKTIKKQALKQVLPVLKLIIEETKTLPQIVQPKVNPKGSFRKDRKNSEEQQITAIEPYMKQIGNELSEQRLVTCVLQQMSSFLPKYSHIEKRKDNKNNQFTCVDFNFEFMACPRLQSFGFVAESTKKILSLIKESEQMGYQNFGSQMVGSTKEFRRAQRYYAENLCGFKHPEYDYEKLMNKILPISLKFYIRLLALSPLHMKRQVLDQVNHEKGEVQLFDLGHTAVLIGVTKLKLALTFTTYYLDY